MSNETMETLNTQTLIGFTEKRGTAWHYRQDLQGGESNHYEKEIPVADVRRRLFGWVAEEGKVLAQTSAGTFEDPTRKAIVRSDTHSVLGVFKSGYQIHQYDEWLVQNVETLLDSPDIKIGSAGLLRGGARAWVQVEVEQTMNAAGIEFRPFLAAVTSMDGSLSSTYVSGAQIVVCDNTLSAALADDEARKVRIKHSRKSLGRLDEIRGALDIVFDIADSFTSQVNRLLDETVTDERWADFVERFTNPNSAVLEGRQATTAARKSDELNRLWFSDGRVAPWANTAYGVLAAVNTWQHHVADVRGADRVTRNMERMVLGKADILDSATLQTLALV